MTRLITTILAVTVLVFVCGCEGFENSRVTEALSKVVENNDPSACNSVDDKTDKDSCFQLAALALRNPAACGSVSDKTQADGCYTRIAQVTKDYSTCWSVKETKQKALCMTIVSAQKASDTADNINNKLSGTQSPIAETTYIKGDVMYKPVGSNEWKPVESDTKFKEGDEIRVGPNSKLRYINGVGTDQAHVEVLIPNTETTVKKPPEPPPRSLTDLTNDLIHTLTKPEEQGQIVTATR
jgi:hypothetical protein